MRGAHGFVCTLAALVILSAGGAKRPDWTRYTWLEQAGEYAIESRSPESYVAHLKRTDDTLPAAACLAIANVHREMWTHNKLVFSVRSLNDKRVHVSATVSYVEGKKVVMKNGGGVDVAGPSWRDVVLGLDSDFGLGDRSIKVMQIKIGQAFGWWKRGEEGGVEVRNVRLCPAAEVTLAGSAAPTTVYSVPAHPPAKSVPRADALRIFFALDNDDVVDVTSSRKKGLEDAQQYWGFREKLLEDLDGAATVTTNLAEAGLIVYSGCRPDPALASAVAVAVTERGIPLYAASEVADPEIAALLPCTLKPRDVEDYPVREPVVFSNKTHPLAQAGGYSTAAFGRYREIALKPGASPVMTFAGGTPAVVEGRAGKGRVIYNMLCLGAGLVPGRKAFDGFLPRVAGYLTGRILPDTRADPVLPEPGGWYRGASAENFGRFGWEIGSGLLVENLGARLAVTKGSHEYVVTFPRGTPARQPEVGTLAIDRCNDLGIGGVVTIDGRTFGRLDVSLAYPGVRWEVFGPAADLSLYNMLGYAAVPTASGVKVTPLAGTERIGVGSWRAPWILLFTGSAADSPLLLVFEHRLQAVRVLSRDGAPEGLQIVAKGDRLGMIVPTWIFGSATADTRTWTGGIPADVLARIGLWYPRACTYPVAHTDRFRLCPEKGRIQITDTFRYRAVTNDWHTPLRPYAPVPPMAYFTGSILSPAERAEGKRLFAGETAISDRGLVTRFGPFADKDASDTVAWSLPIPKPDLGFLPHAEGYPEYEKLANEQFASGVRFSCGGGVKLEEHNKAYPGGRRNPRGRNLNMHGSLLGMCRCTSNPFIYSHENRAAMRRRMLLRMLEPLECHQYKMACRWRREPGSGIDYTIYMNSPRDIVTCYRPETYGSKIIYGDSNETVRMILFCLQVLADRQGQYDIVKANWDVIRRHVASYVLHLDDWGYLASGCLEYGGASSIDMLNSEYGCLCTLARLAEIAGDEAMRQQALYRAALRACPTLARLHMKDYYAAHGLLANPAGWRICEGFNESGAGFRAAGKRVRDVELFDMSQGIPQDLIALYRFHGLEQLRTDYLPDVLAADGAKGRDWIMAAILGIAGNQSDEELAAYLRACQADTVLNARLPRDWPGMDTGSYMEYALHRLTGSPEISDCRDVDLHEATWNAATHTLYLDYTPGPQARLVVRTPAKTVSMPAMPQCHYREHVLF